MTFLNSIGADNKTFLRDTDMKDKKSQLRQQLQLLTYKVNKNKQTCYTLLV